MKSKPVALLLADLGVVKTHNRPHVSDDNPSESQFRTLKYRLGFPDRSGSIEDARGFCQSFFPLVQRPAPTAKPRTSWHIVRSSTMPPSVPIPSASFGDHPDHRSSPPGSGSTGQLRRKYSLNLHARCLIVVDTHRVEARSLSVQTHPGQ